MNLQPHQQRVLIEKSELETRARALSDFIGLNPIFETLDPESQELMKVQNDLMWQLYEVLSALIERFSRG